MIKRKINIIDLDKTLIPYDSFRFLIKEELVKFDLFIIWFTFLRVMRLTSMKNYKMRIILHLQKKYNTAYFKGFSDKLFTDINAQILKLINRETKNDTINILLSASPHIFVKHLIQKLQWKGSGSYFDDDGNFIHLLGENKIKWLKEKYTSHKYNYNFAISDSMSDEKLLSFFKKYLMWKPRN